MFHLFLMVGATSENSIQSDCSGRGMLVPIGAGSPSWTLGGKKP